MEEPEVDSEKQLNKKQAYTAIEATNEYAENDEPKQLQNKPDNSYNTVLEKKVDLLLALLMDEKMWLARHDSSHEFLYQALNELGFDLSLSPDSIRAVQLIHKLKEEYPFILDRQYILEVIDEISIKYESIESEVTSLSNKIESDGNQTREKIFNVREDLISIREKQSESNK